jgi:LysM repeat protein
MKKIMGLACLILLASCAPVSVSPTATLSASPVVQLTPYHTPTPVRSATPLPNQPTPTPLPTPTPTPRVHTVALGEDMSGIALRYRVSLDALKTANPSVNPRIIIVGQQLVIPGTTPIPGTLAPTATAAKVMVEIPRCYQDEAGGAWCFMLVKNLKSEAVESVTVRVRLLDDKGKQAAAQVASSALNLLPAGKSLPVGVYFAAPLPQGMQVAAELVNALPVQNLAARYLGVAVENLRVQVAGDQLSAEVNGELALEKSPPAARQTWVAAAAYAADGRLIGLRRWESTAEWSGNRQAFSLRVYAVGGKIARVEVLVEARP